MNRRSLFFPVLTNPDEMEVHILADEISSRQYIDQVWAEAMELYRSGNYSMKFTPETEKQLEDDLSTFMPEDTQVGIIQAFLDNCSYDYVCTILLYCEACHHPDMEPKSWERREIRDIMDRKIQGWEKTGQHRYREYGKQRSWRRVPVKPVEKPATEGFEPVPEQMSIPFDEETISDNNCLAEDNQKKDSSDVNKGCMGTE